VLHQDPTREIVHRHLMRLYAEMGTPDQAVRQYHRCEELLRQDGGPVVALNHAVALAMARGPEVGLERLGALEPELESYHLFHAARADLLRSQGKRSEAAASYRAALALAANVAERRFLERRLREMTS